MGSKGRRLSYSFTVKVEKHGNQAAEMHFGLPPTDKMIREWRKQSKDVIKQTRLKELYILVLLNGQNLKNMLRTG
jgi:hypothetical protein